MLSALQWSFKIDGVNPLLLLIDKINNNNNKIDLNAKLQYEENESEDYFKYKKVINEIINKFKNLNITNTEFALLKAIVLLKSGNLN